MAKVSGKTDKKAIKRKSTGGKSSKAPDFEKVREKIGALVGGKAVGLVESTMDEAEKGHFTAMKYLFEMVGLYPSMGGELSAENESLAKTLLERLGLPEELANERPDTKDIPAKSVAAVADTVK